MAWIWFLVALTLLIIELVTVQLVCIWVCLAAFVTALIAAIFPSMGIVWQIVIFVALSALLLVATRRVAKKMIENKKINQATNVDINTGKEAVVTEEINNLSETGAIRIGGLVWSARSTDGSVIPAGEVVIFESVQGNKAYVRRKPEPEAGEE
jgi:membrane protein implicated in regulation of membrane protease activity